jgi:hypothetical protein
LATHTVEWAPGENLARCGRMHCSCRRPIPAAWATWDVFYGIHKRACRGGLGNLQWLAYAVPHDILTAILSKPDNDFFGLPWLAWPRDKACVYFLLFIGVCPNQCGRRDTTLLDNMAVPDDM